MFKTNSIINLYRVRRIILLAVVVLLLGLVGTVLAGGSSIVQIVKTGPDSALPGQEIVFTLTVYKYGSDELLSAVVWDDLYYGSLDRYEIFRRNLTEAELASLNAGNSQSVAIDVPFTVPCNAGGHVLDNDAYILATFRTEQQGVGTPGFWMNHPEAWPVDVIAIGGITYDKADAIKYMKMEFKGDKTLTLFPALVAAKLNVLVGNDSSCIADTIAAANAWMAEHPVGSEVAGSSEAWQIAESLYERLDKYNNGDLCAPSRDDVDNGTYTIYSTNDHDVPVNIQDCQ